MGRKVISPGVALVLLLAVMFLGGCYAAGLAVRGVGPAVAGARAGAAISLVRGASATQMLTTRFVAASRVRAAASVPNVSSVSVRGRIAGDAYRASVTPSRIIVESGQGTRSIFTTRRVGHRVDVFDESGKQMASSFESFGGRKVQHFAYDDAGRPVFTGSDTFVSKSKIIHYDGQGYAIGRSVLNLETAEAGQQSGLAALVTTALFDQPVAPENIVSICSFKSSPPRIGRAEAFDLIDAAPFGTIVDNIRFVSDDTYFVSTSQRASIVRFGKVLHSLSLRNARLQQVGTHVFTVLNRSGLHVVRMSDWRSIRLHASQRILADYSPSENALIAAQGDRIEKIDFETGKVVSSTTIDIAEDVRSLNNMMRLSPRLSGRGYELRHLEVSNDGSLAVLFLHGSPSIISVWDTKDLIELDRHVFKEPFRIWSSFKTQFVCQNRFFILVEIGPTTRYTIFDLVEGGKFTQIHSNGEIVFTNDLRHYFHYETIINKLSLFELLGGQSRVLDSKKLNGTVMSVNSTGNKLILGGVHGKFFMVDLK